MDFEDLRLRLVANLRQRVCQGEWTERALARHVGVSQPHLHNILNGTRVLTPEIADAVLRSLGLDLLSLAHTDELELALERDGAGDPVWIVVPVAHGLVGPTHRIPRFDAHAQVIRIESAGIPEVRDPVLVELGIDPALAWLDPGSSMALLERSRWQREQILDDAWYAVRWGEYGLIRRVRRQGKRLLLISQMDLFDALPLELPLDERPLLDLLLGRVVWIGPDPRATRRLNQRGLLPVRAIS